MMYAQYILKEYFRENNLNQASEIGNNLWEALLGNALQTVRMMRQNV